MMQFTPTLDLFPIAAAVLASVACGVLGNFLVLRRLSLMGDAISHSVLPGLVIAFLLTTSRSPAVMFVGAAAAGIATVALVEIVKRLGRVEPGAAMGVVFSVLFALGVLLIERAAVRHVDLDADCVLHGQLEMLWWNGAPESWAAVLSRETLPAIPRQVWTLLATCVLAVVLTTAFFKELRISAFDPSLATSVGIHAGVMHHGLMVMVAVTTVASFEAVGSILVIAMLVCPAATARLLTDRLRTQVALSVLISVITAVGGYVAAAAIPAAFGWDAVSAAGSMTVAAGVILATTIVASPQHGLIARLLRRRALARGIARDHLLAVLHRLSERGEEAPTRATVAERAPATSHARALPRVIGAGLVATEGTRLRLTEAGRLAARDVVRRHRLWETWLVAEAGMAPDHVHEAADRLEHLPVMPELGPRLDPHGTPIPSADDGGPPGGPSD